MSNSFTLSTFDNSSISDQVVYQASIFPDHTAIVDGESRYSYAQIDQLSRKLAEQIEAQVPNEKYIAVSARRDFSTILAVISILRAGYSYVPVDLSHPKARVKQTIQDSGLHFFISDDAEDEKIFLELGLARIAESSHDIGGVNSEQKRVPGYVLFTSGSTGVPKGVQMPEEPLQNLLRWQAKESIATVGTKTLQFSPLTFDVSFQEIFATLTTGGTLVLIEDDIRLDPYELLAFIESNDINRLFLPFVALQNLANAAVGIKRFPECLQEIMTAGEQLKITPQIRSFFQSLNCVLYNQYGPTECHVVTQLKLAGDPDEWPALPDIGKAIDNVEVYILNEQLELVGNDEEGELCLAGKCLADGYINQPELTAEKFINWQHPEHGQIRIYKTGDTAKWLPDGQIELLGRKDQQVKIRGYRIEIGEIEVALNAIPGVQEAAVTIKKSNNSDNTLVAYLVGTQTSHSDLRNELLQAVPDYMIPSSFIWLDELPKTTSGKIDRKALPEPEKKRPQLTSAFERPTTSLHQTLADIWSKLLEIDKVGVSDNFFELGGNSLLAIRLISEINDVLNVRIPITKLYQNPRIDKLSKFITGTETSAEIKPIMPQNGKDVAVIGMAGRFPGADTVEEFWDNLVAGKESIHQFNDSELDPTLDPEELNDDNYVKARGIINGAENFDASFFGINPKAAELMDPQQRVFLEIAWEVLEKCGYLAPNAQPVNIGVYAGCGNNTYYLNNVLPNEQLISNVGSFQVMTTNEKDYIASRTAYQLNLKGPAVSVFSGCSTSLLAVAQAVESIRSGKVAISIAGGVSVTSPINSGYLYKDGAMFSPDGHCRPFDENAHGTIFCDGAGVVLLKDLAAAERDRDKIYGVIKGIGINNDGHDKGNFVAPSSDGQAGAIAMAIADAGISSADIGYVEAHGTATVIGDPIELDGLKTAFGEYNGTSKCFIGSVKGNIGHLTAAAGVAGLIKTVLALHHKKIPASINYSSPNPHLLIDESPFVINKDLQSWESNKKRYAGVSSFGVGGTNVHAVIEEYTPKSGIESAGFERDTQLICWSAKSQRSLDLYAEKFSEFIKSDESQSLANIAFTLHIVKPEFNYRGILLASKTSGVIEAINTKSFYSIHRSTKPSGVAFVFSGQGCQRVGMMKEIYDKELAFRQAADECFDIIKNDHNLNLKNIVFGDDPESSEIHNTKITQPALFVIEYALARLWQSWGVEPSQLIGHSIGEFVAAHIAGIFSLKDALHLVVHRGRLMSEQPAGSMAAVKESDEQTSKNLPSGLSIAAVNTGSNTVVSGPTEVLEKYLERLSDEGIKYTKLKTSHAFHSEMMQPAAESFLDILKEVEFNSPKIPIISTATGHVLSDSEAVNPAYWAGQMRKPVLFKKAISTLAESGVVILEIGPQNSVQPMILQILAGKDIPSLNSISTEITGTSEHQGLLHALGELWAYGISPDWEAFYAGQQRLKVDLPTYAFDKKRCWVDKPIRKQQFTEISNNILPTMSVENSSNDRMLRKSNLQAKLRQILTDASGIDLDQSNSGASFIELGFDSLLLTQVTLTLKKEFKLPITFRQLNSGLHTIDLLTEFLVENSQENVQTTPPSPKSGNAIASSQPSIDALSAQLQHIASQLEMMRNGSAPAMQAQSSVTQSRIELSIDEEIELKKPFGATARIDRQGKELTEAQRAFLNDFTKKYNAKTAKSKEYTQKHRMHMADPRVVSGFRPQTKELVYPIVVERSLGSHLWDLDGNEYIDALNGFGSNMLGNQHPEIKEAVKKQVEDGYEIGPQHVLAGDVCQLLCEFTGFDRAALCNTGSEAVLGAMRIARTVTGRTKIIAFNGSYHGINDEVIVRGTKMLKAFPAAPGIMPEAVQNMLIIDYGTPESLEIIRQNAHDVAAILIEPVQSRRPEFQPVEFLKEVRKIATESGAIMIFDEVITGFRMHPGGCQAIFGIQADLATYGKVIGGGMPIGAIAGKKEFMDALDGGFWTFGDKSIPEAGVTYFAGTFVRHPLALAAAKASLTYMKKVGPALQENLTNKTEALVNELNKVCKNMDIPVYAASFGSLWKIKFETEHPYTELLFTMMRFKGIHIWDNFPCFLTEAHTSEEVGRIATAFRESVEELQKLGFFPGSKANFNSDSIVDNVPPVPGAKLGKDRFGNPAWFIADPNSQGKYLQIEQLN